MKTGRKLKLIFLMLAAVLIVGVTGYSILLGVNFVDALYMTVITISTVGLQRG